jgi:hypothetical protein
VIRFRQIVGPSYGSYRIRPSPHSLSLCWYYFTFSRSCRQRCTTCPSPYTCA